MAREQSTGLILKEGMLEWTALQRSKAQFMPVGSGRAEIPAIPAAATDEEKAGLRAERVARLKSSCAGMKGLVSAAIASERVLLRVVEMPTLVDSELADMVSLQVDKFSPFPLDSLVVSHEILLRKADSTTVVIAACQQSAVDSLEKALKEFGVLAGRMDVAVLGWLRLLRDAGEIPEKGRHLVILMAGGAPDIVVFEDGLPRVFRALAGLDEVSGEELEAELISEINFSLLSLDLEQGEGGACGITVWYAGAEPAALAARLANELAHKVALKPLSSLPSLSEGMARRGASRGGLVDLTPPEWRSEERARVLKKRMLLLLLGVVGAWLLMMAGVAGWIYYQKAKLRSLLAQRAELAKPVAEVQELRRRVLMVQRYVNQKDSALETLREVCALQPQGVDLTSFSYRKEEGLKISGEAQAVSQVYDFKTGLDASKMFRAATITGPRSEPRSGKQLFEFDLKLGGGAE